MSIATAIQRLSDAKTAIATAITTKGGTVASGDGFEDFASDIASIPSGTDVSDTTAIASDVASGKVFHLANGNSTIGTAIDTSFLDYADRCNYMFCDVNLGAFDRFEIYLKNCTRFENTFQTSIRSKKTYSPKHIVIKSDAEVASVSYVACSDSGGTAVLEKITFDMNFSESCSFYRAFLYQYALKTIEGNLAGVFRDTFDNCNALEDITFVNNCLSITGAYVSLRSQFLTDASLVSIANGLNESTTGVSVNLGSTPKARLSTIMGTVALDQTSTYHIFTADASGTTTLQDFITTVKGWSIA